MSEWVRTNWDFFNTVNPYRINPYILTTERNSLNNKSSEKTSSCCNVCAVLESLQRLSCVTGRFTRSFFTTLSVVLQLNVNLLVGVYDRFYLYSIQFVCIGFVTNIIGVLALLVVVKTNGHHSLLHLLLLKFCVTEFGICIKYIFISREFALKFVSSTASWIILLD